MARLPHGFGAKANRIALGLRRQSGLPDAGPYDPRGSLDKFSIPVVPLSSFREECPQSFSVLSSDSGGFSAALIPVGGRRIVIHDDSHSPGRQNSDLAHELAHVLLAHSSEVLLCSGSPGRNRDSQVELEAAYLGGCILIPNEAAHRIAALRIPVESAARSFGVSEEMVTYRLRVSGALKRAGRRP